MVTCHSRRAERAIGNPGANVAFLDSRFRGNDTHVARAALSAFIALQ
jgi:hypothetical protein